MNDTLQNFLQNFLKTQIWNNSVWQYLQAGFWFFGLIMSFYLFHIYILQKLKHFSHQTNNKVDDLVIRLIDSTGWIVYIVLSVYIATISLQISDFYRDLLRGILIVVATYYFARGLNDFVNYQMHIWLEKKKNQTHGNVDPSLIQLSGLLSNFVVWVVAILLIFQTFNINVATLVGTLGIGGIAIAFALQNVLSDIFASFSIYFDRPFAVGDFITIGTDSGTVQRIGIKSTRIKTLQGEEMVFSNRELTEVRIHNFAKLERRRVVFCIAVEYATNGHQLRLIPDIIQKMIESIEICQFERSHFKEYAELGLVFETVYYVDSSDYITFMDIQQKINLDLKDALEKEDIQIVPVARKIISVNG